MSERITPKRRMANILFRGIWQRSEEERDQLFRRVNFQDISSENFCYKCRKTVDVVDGDCVVCATKAREKGEPTPLEKRMLHILNKPSYFELLSPLDAEWVKSYTKAHPLIKQKWWERLLNIKYTYEPR